MNKHGYRNIIINGRKEMYPLDTIQNTVALLIQRGCVLQIAKTKAGRTDHLNGKNVVTIGPYQRATDDKTRRYAMYIGNDKTEYLDPVSAARDFIAWCGTHVAREAVREYARSNS